MNLAVSSTVVMYEIAIALQNTDVHADGSTVKPIAVVSHLDCQKRAAEIIGTLDMTDVFDKGKDNRERSLRYIQTMLSQASLTPFESNWIKKMVLRIRPFINDKTFDDFFCHLFFSSIFNCFHSFWIDIKNVMIQIKEDLISKRVVIENCLCCCEVYANFDFNLAYSFSG